MGNWAIIRAKGKQYKVKEGDEITIDKISQSDNTQILFDEILLYVNKDKLTLGTPLVAKAKVKGKVLQTLKGKKIRVVKFKPKSKYLRVRGHRQQKSQVLIEKIQL